MIPTILRIMSKDFRQSHIENRQERGIEMNIKSGTICICGEKFKNHIRIVLNEYPPRYRETIYVCPSNTSGSAPARFKKQKIHRSSIKISDRATLRIGRKG